MCQIHKLSTNWNSVSKVLEYYYDCISALLDRQSPPGVAANNCAAGEGPSAPKKEKIITRKSSTSTLKWIKWTPVDSSGLKWNSTQWTWSNKKLGGKETQR